MYDAHLYWKPWGLWDTYIYWLAVQCTSLLEAMGPVGYIYLLAGCAMHIFTGGHGICAIHMFTGGLDVCVMHISTGGLCDAYVY